MTLTTPHSVGWKFVLDTFVANLQKHDRNAMDQYNSQNPKSPRNFYIAKVYSPTEPQLIKDDSARIGDLRASYSAANILFGKAPDNSQPAPAIMERPPMLGGMRPPGYGGYGGYNHPPGTPGGSYGPPPGVPGAGYRPPGAQAPLINGSDPALLDRLTNEDMQNDWDMKVRAVIVIDPPSKAPAAP
jgi:hypothetical protein